MIKTNILEAIVKEVSIAQERAALDLYAIDEIKQLILTNDKLTTTEKISIEEKIETILKDEKSFHLSLQTIKNNVEKLK